MTGPLAIVIDARNPEFVGMLVLGCICVGVTIGLVAVCYFVIRSLPRR